LCTGDSGYWPCSIKWSERIASECYLGSRWKRFVKENCLAVGDCIKLEVDKDYDSLITVQKI